MATHRGKSQWSVFGAMIGMFLPSTAPAQWRNPEQVSNPPSMRSKSSPVGMRTYLGVNSSCITRQHSRTIDPTVETPTPNSWLSVRYSTFVACLQTVIATRCFTLMAFLGHPQIQREHFIWPGIALSNGKSVTRIL